MNIHPDTFRLVTDLVLAEQYLSDAIRERRSPEEIGSRAIDVSIVKLEILGTIPEG